MPLLPNLKPISLGQANFKDCWEAWTFTRNQKKFLLKEVKDRLSIYRAFERAGGELPRGHAPQATRCVLHEDRKKSFRITDTYVKCYAGCGDGDVLWLLKELYGDERSWGYIIKQADEDFNLGITRDPVLAKRIFEDKLELNKAVRRITRPRPPVDRAKLHRVYSYFIQMLPLLERHKKAWRSKRLLKEGLITRLEAKGYRSWHESWEQPILLALANGLGSAAFVGVPGFYVENGNWRLKIPSGFVLPIMNDSGSVNALHVRVDDPDADYKFKYVSSSSRERGTKAQTETHVAKRSRQSKNVWVVEGVMKSDIAADLLGDKADWVFGMAGVGNVSESLFEYLKKFTGAKVIIAIDVDWKTNKPVRKGLIRLVKMLGSFVSSENLRLADWPTDQGKGIDDYLVQHPASGIGLRSLA